MHSYIEISSKRETSSTTDISLVDQVKNRRVSALQEIYRRYARLVHVSALRILKSREEAEDITQEIFLLLWHGCRYDGDRGSFKNFLVMKTRSRAIDRLRSHQANRRTAQRFQTTAEIATQNNPIEQAAQKQVIQSVRNALCELSLKEREVLEKAYYKGMSQTEIANRLDIPLGTVKSRSLGGLRKLRRTLTAQQAVLN